MDASTDNFELSGRAQDRIKIAGVFWAGLRSIGLNPATVIRCSGLPPTVYSGATAVTTAQMFAIWRAIAKLANDSTVGWKFMSLIETDQYHPTLVAALHARTYRESIRRLARYKQLCSAEEFRLTQQRDEVSVEVRWPFAREETPPDLTIDAVFALVTELGRRGTKTRLSPKRVELARLPAKGSGLEAYYGSAVRYRAARNALILRAADFDLPFVTPNEELIEMLSPQLENRLKQGPAGQGIRGQVKWVLQRMLSGSRPDLPLVAKELGMGERTLQRRITEEGTSFRQVLNETRQELVREYLRDDSLEITETAFLVGYEDPTSFYRAFRSWEGTTPAEWRAAHRKRA